MMALMEEPIASGEFLCLAVEDQLPPSRTVRKTGVGGVEGRFDIRCLQRYWRATKEMKT